MFYSKRWDGLWKLYLFCSYHNVNLFFFFVQLTEFAIRILLLPWFRVVPSGLNDVWKRMIKRSFPLIHSLSLNEQILILEDAGYFQIVALPFYFYEAYFIQSCLFLHLAWNFSFVRVKDLRLIFLSLFWPFAKALSINSLSLSNGFHPCLGSEVISSPHKVNLWWTFEL